MKQRSTSHSAIYQRTRRLVDDAYDQKQAASAKRAYGKLMTKKITERNTLRMSLRMKGLLKHVRHHLGRGRDASDIAIRENIPVSKVMQLIELAKQEAAK